MEKLAIVEYFDSVINQVDLITETKIQQDQRLEDFYNERRQKQIEIVREIEKENLSKLKKRKIQAREESHNERGFCFVIEYADGWFLITADQQATTEEVDFFKSLVGFLNSSYRERLKDMNDNGGVPRWRYWTCGNSIKISINPYIDLSQFRNVKSPVIDIGSWINDEFNVEEMRIDFGYSSSLQCIHKPYNRLFKIKTLRISFSFTKYQKETKSITDAVNQVVSCFGKVKNVILDINWHCEERIDELVEALRLNSIHEKLSILVTLEPAKSSFTKEQSFIEYMKQKELIQSDLCLLSKPNWSLLEKLFIGRVLLQDLEAVDFSSLQSLKILDIWSEEGDKANIDWAFLDPVRENLEEFTLRVRSFERITWKTFRGMRQLQYLYLSVILANVNSELDLDEQGQLFADLHSLRELELEMKLDMMTTGWTVDLPNLERLSIRPDLTREEGIELMYEEILVRFNLPKLVKLELNLDEYPYYLDIPFATNQFCGIQELQLCLPDLEYVRSGHFREFKSLKKLWLFITEQEEIDSEIFIGLENIVELTIETSFTTSGALSQLKDLEIIKIRPWEDDWIKDGYKQSLFDGLVSLKEIIIENVEIEDDYIEPIESFVYFENLNKFILETKFLPSTEEIESGQFTDGEESGSEESDHY